MYQSYTFGILITVSSVIALLLLIIIILILSRKKGYNISSILASALAFIGALLGFTFQIGMTIIENNSTPGSYVNPFIEDIVYGIPEIPSRYTVGVTKKDVIEDLIPLINSNEVLSLSLEEAKTISSLANKSGQADPVVANRSYTTTNIAEKLVEPMKFYHLYKIDYPARLEKWSDILNNFEGEDLTQFMDGFLNDEVRIEIDNAMVFSTIIGQLNRGAIEINEFYEDGIENELNFVTRSYYDEYEEDLLIEFNQWALRIGIGDDIGTPRYEFANRVRDLIIHAKIKTLSKLFFDAAKELKESAPFLKDYVEEWNKVIRNRKGESLILKVTFSNLSKYDSFVRTIGKFAVGGVGDDSLKTIQAKISAISNIEDMQIPISEPFIAVKSRESITLSFMCNMSEEDSEKLFGAYKGGLNYMSAVFIASIGEGERQIYTPITPFSKEAKNQILKTIENINLKIE